MGEEGKDRLRWRYWPDNDSLWVITGNMRQRSPQLSPYLALYWLHTVAQSQLGEETFIIIFTNLFHQLSKPSYGRDIEIINLYLNRAPTYRPSYWLSPRVLTHSKLPASLFVSLWHLKTPRRLGTILHVLPCSQYKHLENNSKFQASVTDGVSSQWEVYSADFPVL